MYISVPLMHILNLLLDGVHFVFILQGPELFLESVGRRNGKQPTSYMVNVAWSMPCGSQDVLYIGCVHRPDQRA